MSTTTAKDVKVKTAQQSILVDGVEVCRLMIDTENNGSICIWPTDKDYESLSIDQATDLHAALGVALQEWRRCTFIVYQSNSARAAANPIKAPTVAQRSNSVGLKR